MKKYVRGGNWDAVRSVTGAGASPTFGRKVVAHGHDICEIVATVDHATNWRGEEEQLGKV